MALNWGSEVCGGLKPWHLPQPLAELLRSHNLKASAHPVAAFFVLILISTDWGNLLWPFLIKSKLFKEIKKVQNSLLEFNLINLNWKMKFVLPLYSFPPERSKGGSLEFSLWFFCISIMGKWGDITCPSVTSSAAHTFKARGLKYGGNNHHIGGPDFIFLADYTVSAFEGYLSSSMSKPSITHIESLFLNNFCKAWISLELRSPTRSCSNEQNLQQPQNMFKKFFRIE